MVKHHCCPSLTVFWPSSNTVTHNHWPSLTITNHHLPSSTIVHHPTVILHHDHALMKTFPLLNGKWKVITRVSLATGNSHDKSQEQSILATTSASYQSLLTIINPITVIIDLDIFRTILAGLLTLSIIHHPLWFIIMFNIGQAIAP